MRRLAGPITKIVLILAVLAYVFPTMALVYVFCGIYDVLRNTERTPELFEKYFLGEGLPVWLPSPVWLLSPLNALLDLLSLPFVNRGVFRLDDLPQTHRKEIVRLIESTRALDVAIARSTSPRSPTDARRSSVSSRWKCLTLSLTRRTSD